MKKSKIFIIAVLIGVCAGVFFLLQFIKRQFDDYTEEDLFDDDTDLDFADDDFEDEPAVPPVKEEKPAKTAKIRRGYIPIRFHKEEASS